jgi:hypothetical protein
VEECASEINKKAAVLERWAIHYRCRFGVGVFTASTWYPYDRTRNLGRHRLARSNPLRIIVWFLVSPNYQTILVEGSIARRNRDLQELRI